MNPALHALRFCIPTVLLACSHIGPSTVARDRFDYSSVITESWKKQTLLNIVKLRYMDPPVFVDVGQIVAGYTLETSVSGGGTVSGDPPGAAIGGLSGSLGGSVRFTDRPTVTYVPMTGNKFVRALMTPLPPDSVFAAIPAGWPADSVLGAGVMTINGLNNMRGSVAGVTPADPGFLRVLQLMTEIQMSGAISMRVKKQGEGTGTLLVIRKDPSPEILAKGVELRKLLGIDPDTEDLQLVFGALPQNKNEIAVVTRSVLHIMQILAAGVEVPQSEIDEGRAIPGLAAGAHPGHNFRVHCSDPGSGDAFVSVQYRDHTYWVADKDIASKRALAFLMMLFTMSDPGNQEGNPVLTIQT